MEFTFDDSSFAFPVDNVDTTEVNKDDNTQEIDEKINTSTENKEEILNSEGVGAEETKEKEDTDTSLQGDKSSPKNFYSATALAFKEDGIFPDLSTEDIENAKTPEDFADLIQKQIDARFDQEQLKIKEALEGGIEPSEINEYKQTLSYLDNIAEETLKEENKEAETLRKRLIYQDFINKGFNEDRAKKEVEKSFNAGADVEDAIEALNSNIEFYKDKYNNILEEGKKYKVEAAKKQKEFISNLEKTIKDTSDPFGVKITEQIKGKIKDNIFKPIYKDEAGIQYNAIQKFQKENPIEYQYKIGLLYTLTDGFKNIDSLIKNGVQKQTKKSIKELEHTINSTSRNVDGSLNFVGDTSDTNTNIGFSIDI